MVNKKIRSMKNNNLFSETQKITQWWIWLIMLVVSLSFIFTAYRILISDNTVSSFGIVFGFFIVIFLNILLLTIRLKTIITEDGIYVKLFPLHLSYKYYSLDLIDKIYIRKYNPILEFGGWGIRGFRKNRALNISGNNGIQIIFKNKRKLLIGTNKTVELENALKYIKFNDI